MAVNDYVYENGVVKNYFRINYLYFFTSVFTLDKFLLPYIIKHSLYHKFYSTTFDKYMSFLYNRNHYPLKSK